MRAQIVCADLAVERQTVLKEQIGDQFARLNTEDASRTREMVFILNQEGRPLANVLMANPKADVVLTGFNATRKVEGFGTTREEAMVGDDNPQGLNIDPTLRLGAYIELTKLIEKGHFKMRRMIFVGDLNLRIREFLKLGFEVSVELFADQERHSSFEPVKIKSTAQLPKIKGFPEKGQIDPSDISTLTIGEITFDGVINMEEDGGHFYIKDFTIDDSVKKMLALDAAKTTLVQEAVKEEKLVFVRTKRIFLVMEPSLAKIVHQRLSFDKMELVFEYPDAATALKALDEQKSGGVANFLETQGYDVINKILDAPERELMLVAAIGRQLMPEYLEKEFKASGDNLKLLKEEEFTQLVDSMEPKVLDRLTAKLQEESMAVFLSRIPPEIREPLIVEFLKDKAMAIEAWRVIGPKGQKEVLVGQSVDILASIVLTNSALFKAKFPDTSFNQDASYDSAKQFASLDAAGVKLRMEIFTEGLKDKMLSYAEWATIFDDAERDGCLASYISLRAEAFFNNLDPAYRKIIWNQIGKKGEKQINAKLTAEQKKAILKGAKEEVFKGLKSDLAHLLNLVKTGDGLFFGQTLFLLLKQFNKVESKTGLFKKITTNPKLKAHRIEGISNMLATPAGQPIFAKLTAQVEGLNLGVDGLICMKDGQELLTAHEAFKDATITVVEDLVDASLLEMFSRGKIDPKNYDAHQKKVEAKLNELKAKLRDKGADDPVGGYLLETMLIMLNMASEALRGKLDQKMVDQLDERGKVKEEVMNNVQNRIDQLQNRVAEVTQRLPQVETQLKADAEVLAQFSQKTAEKLNGLQTSLTKYQDAAQKLSQYTGLKVKVAKTQQQLSQRLYEIIRPLILQKLRFLPSPLARVIEGVKQSFLSETIPKRRLIFKFTDDELKGIAKRKIVFATEDEMLKRFLATCLQIDKLDNTLFQITGINDLPESPDILFIGNDLLEYDFSDIIKEQFTVPFADDLFYKALVHNESQKTTIRTNLVRYGEYRDKLKKYLETEGSKLKLMAESQKAKKSGFDRLKAERAQMQNTFLTDQQRLSFLAAEKETLDQKFALVDEKFKVAKEAVTQAISSGGSTAQTASAQAKELAGGLSGTLEEINKELAGLVFVKTVKDTVERISTTAQEKIIAEVDKLSQVKGGKNAVRHIVASGDGMLDTLELMKAFDPAVKSYFGTAVKYEDLGLGRMEAEIAEQGKRPHLLMIIGDDSKSNLSNYREMAKRLRKLTPESCILFFTGYNVGEGAPAEMVKNLNILRKYGTPINTNLMDYSNPAKLVELLAQVAPDKAIASKGAGEKA
ncbi:MAG: hypothetical protein A2600_11315 [Candidatus Lambdaproteobacteria bacterium RIFOXYD1_FULL_56_27]|nr:MAG: hypothetical protein A2426_08410 [Candidatus Lambdaproteobacteria bacterium RIFOXYC1_FULL_56_13]OGH07677.1 MAG: hypothetical protein A2600_11315 [Candidatus Lambdaproteobacteria bacterium RIFOXYD1_FULL_56_27]